jgi:phosphoribosylformylglycinamidine cyclo-ligase
MFLSIGGQTKVLHFIDKLHVIKDNLFPLPPLFQMIHEQSPQTTWREMYRVFNMGHRMELYVRREVAPALIAISQKFGVDARVVGRVEASQTKSLTITSEFGTFEYN